MALIIHRYLFEKLGKHPEWVQYRETYEELTGFPVRLEETPPGYEGEKLTAKIDVRGVLVGVLVVDGLGPGGSRGRACQHLLTLASERFASVLSMSNIHDHEYYPMVVRKTTRWIREHALTSEIRLTEAAADCSLSASHLSRLFHQTTGLTFQEYVRRFRLEHAAGLLKETDLTVTEIAFESGFQSISQFHRSFKAVYGKKPLEYRKEDPGNGEVPATV